MPKSPLLTFPDPVNEKAARSVAAGVAVLGLAALATGWHWLLVVLTLGFLGRVLSGPTLSPLGRLAAEVLAPRLGPPRLVAGPPKRFAQGIGLTLTTAASVLAIGFGLELGASALLAVLVAFATLEAAAGFCAGCWVFGRLVRARVISGQACPACADIRLRTPA